MHRSPDYARIRAMNREPRSKSTLLIAVLTACLALLGGVWAAARFMAPAELDAGAMNATHLTESRELVDFELVSHQGEAFTRDSLEDRWTLLFFGFTNCPDICPMTLFELAGVREYLAEENLADAIRTVFVTVDPARDTPEQLAAYVPEFDPTFIGVTGELEEIDRLARDVGIAHARHDQNGGDDYLVDHGTAVLLINPRAELQAVFTAPHRAASMASDLERILAFHDAGN